MLGIAWASSVVCSLPQVYRFIYTYNTQQLNEGEKCGLDRLTMNVFSLIYVDHLKSNHWGSILHNRAKDRRSLSILFITFSREYLLEALSWIIVRKKVLYCFLPF